MGFLKNSGISSQKSNQPLLTNSILTSPSDISLRTSSNRVRPNKPRRKSTQPFPTLRTSQNIPRTRPRTSPIDADTAGLNQFNRAREEFRDIDEAARRLFFG